MVQLTVQVSDELATRLQPIKFWLPTIIELSLIRCQTAATATASEIIDFLSENPTPTTVLAYHVSEETQARVERLLALNEVGLLSAEEQLELDEREQIEHILIMLKTQIASQQI